MWRSFGKRMAVAAAVALTTAVAFSPDAAVAAEHDLTFPVGVACNFELAIDVAGGDKRVDRTFVMPGATRCGSCRRVSAPS
jgi:hypothetical protein